MEDDDFLSDDPHSSGKSCQNSDDIDSEAEAELYSLIHYQDNFSSNICNETSSTSKITGETEKNDSYRSSLDSGIRPQNSKSCDSGNISSESFRAVKEKEYERESDSNASFNSAPGKSYTTEYNSDTDSDSIVVISSDSDNDSIDWTNKDFQRSFIQTNIDDDEVQYLGSDTSSDSLPPMESKKAYAHNQSMPNIKIGESSKGSQDLWYINNEDLYRMRNRLNRYHKKREFCYKCMNTGHSEKFCSTSKNKKCFICGGSHSINFCRNKICFKCYRKGHDSNNCYIRTSNICHHCNLVGHSKADCPDIWRRYHLTTKSGDIVPGRLLEQDRPIYCFNCGMSGHIGTNCRKHRALRGFPTWPSVISYDDPNKRQINKSKAEFTNEISQQEKFAFNFEGRSKEKVVYNRINYPVNGLLQQGKRNKSEFINRVEQKINYKQIPQKNTNLLESPGKSTSHLNSVASQSKMNILKNLYENKRKIARMLTLTRKSMTTNKVNYKKYIRRIESLPVNFPENLKQNLEKDFVTFLPQVINILKKDFRLLSRKIRSTRKRKSLEKNQVSN